MRKLATIRTVSDVLPIEGADLIELVVVDGWKCVAKKGEYQERDAAIYCEVDSFLPVREEFEFLRKSSLKMMNGREGFRLRTIKLRGQISQGLLIDPKILNREFTIGEDVTQELGIEKYEAPVPACLNGEVTGAFPGYLAKTDEERIQNLAADYELLKSLSWHVSEKLDGTSFTAFLKKGQFGVCSRNWQLAESQTNSHWQVAKDLNLENHLSGLGRSIALQGELIGPGIQKNRYALDKPTVYFFNAFDIGSTSYLDKREFESICDRLGLEIVPSKGTIGLPDSIEEILEFADGKSELNKKTEREGLVWVSGAGADRVSFKTISNRFLTEESD